MKHAFQHFAKDTSGAVTIEWVVLTAATVALSLAVMGVVRDGVGNLSQEIADHLSNIQIRTTFEQWDTFRNPPVPDPDSGQD
jgi:Flp pilus assembly pilin Flp